MLAGLDLAATAEGSERRMPQIAIHHMGLALQASCSFLSHSPTCYTANPPVPRDYRHTQFNGKGIRSRTFSYSIFKCDPDSNISDLGHGRKSGSKIVQVIHRTVRMQLLRSPRLLVRFVSLKSNGSCVRRPGPQLTFISCYPPKLLSLWML